jgi:hypothetical protein
MKLLLPVCIFVLTLLSAFAPRNNKSVVKDYFAVPGPLEFNRVNYLLSWSSHPNATYYKQEYLPAGEKADKYSRMLLLEVVTGDFSLQQLVKAKTAELEQRKQTDPVANYSLIQNPNTGEYLLDFVLSQGEGANSMVEWNVYRYIKLKDKAGKKGVQLIAYSRRAYGDAGKAFLQQLKAARPLDIKVMAAYNVPELKLAE